MTLIEKLTAQWNASLDAAKAIEAKAKEETRDQTEDETASIGGHLADAKATRVEREAAVVAQAERDQQAADLAAEMALAAVAPTVVPRISERPVVPLNAAALPVPAVHTATPAVDNGIAGFSGLGDFCQTVARAADPARLGLPMDPRLAERYSAISGHNESVASEGGFLVGTDEMTDLMQRTYNNTTLLAGGQGFSGAQRIPISNTSNGVKINSLNETSRADGSRWGGIRAYWASEGAEKTDSKAEFKQISLELKKLIGLAYATDELLADTTALEAVISAAFVGEFSFKIQKALFSGIGGGVPLGILNAPATVSVAAEGGQAAKTIVKENIDKMWSRMWPSSISNSVWFINQNAYPALFSMTQDVGTGGAPVYLPPGGLSVSPFGTLMGRPVVPIEQCETLGTKGDIVFADMSQYLFADKGGIDSASSIHVRFIYDETAFRFVLRVDGRPAWNAPLTPFKDSTTSSTVSPFITLATRA
jgi:HK97 family phage major capsid protein